MIQYFILEQLTYFKRYALEKQLFYFEGALPDLINPFIWFAAWFVLIGSNLFFVYWILMWGVRNGGSTLANWCL